MKNNQYTREELISICEDAVVHHTRWGNRDSYSSQVLLSDIYYGLTGGVPFEIEEDTDDRTIWILFSDDFDSEKLEYEGQHLSISSLEDYRQDCDPGYESEMFDGYGIDFYDKEGRKGGYMPTRKRLEEASGDDWY